MEENSYFKSLVKEALEDLKNKGFAYVYSDEQLEEVKKTINKNIKVVIEDNVYYLYLC